MAWSFLAVTFLLHGLIAPAHAGAPPKPAAPRLLIENSRPKALAPAAEALKKAVKAAYWSVLKIANMEGIRLERGFALAPVFDFDICGGN